MYLDLTDLSLRSGERYERVYPLEVAPIIMGGASFQVLVPEGVAVTVSRVAGGFLLEVALDARVYGPCARCLCEVVQKVHAEQQEFAPTAKGGWEESDLSEFVEGMVADISGIAREALVLALPPRLACSVACKGLCPRCGHDLNQGACGCLLEEPDERWGKLKDLLSGDEASP